MTSKEQKLVATARELARTTDSWADLSNALFDPAVGLLARAYPTRAERDAFVKTKAYKIIRSLIDKAEDRSGLVEGATPSKSGKFVVRLPRTLHASLVAEAKQEGVSLNHLVVAKLAMQMSQLVTRSESIAD